MKKKKGSLHCWQSPSARLVLLFAGAVLAGEQADAQLLINGDINIPASPTQTGIAVLGFSNADYWNGLTATGSPATYNSIRDSNGNLLSGISIAYDWGNNGNAFEDPGATAMDPATTPLMEDYIYAVPPAVIDLTISDLTIYAGDSFTLVVYAAGDAPNAGARMDFLQGYSAVNSDVEYTSASSRQISAGPGVAYNVFTGALDGNDVKIELSNSAGAPALNGFQLEITTVPEPSALVLLGIGSLILLRLHRRRRKEQS